MKSVLALTLSAITSLAAFPQVARDSRPAPVVGSSTIGGRVITIGDTPAPVRRARVAVTSTNLEVTRSVITDDDGRFVLPGLPAGRYTISATKAGWLRSSYGSIRPTRPGTAVNIAAGQTVNDLVLQMARGGVVTGLITDGEGRPARGVPVRLQEARTIGGQRVLGAVSISPGVTGEVTDDRGEFRLFGLPAGEYIVSAAPVDASGGVTRLMSGGTIGAVPNYFPGTTNADDAQTVAVRAGEEIGGVNFRLQFVKTARVEGRISGPATLRPQDVQLTLIPRAAGPAGGFTSAVAALRSFAGVMPDWTFSYAGVTPGNYTLAARVIERSATAEAQSAFRAFTSGTTQLWALAEIVVDGADRSNIDLTLQPPLTISGRVVLQGASAAASPELSRVRVSLSSAAQFGSGLALAIPTATPDASGRFVLRGVVPGQYRVGGYITGANTGQWRVSSAVLDGREALDFPIDIRADERLDGLAVTMTDVTQQVSGQFQDALGRPSSAFTVVLFPADPSLRAVSRRIRTARPGQDGRYTISSVPEGDYRLAAVFDITTAEANDPQFLETLVAASIPISIKPGERKIQNVKVSR